MEQSTIAALILKNAETITKMHEEMNASFKNRKKKPDAWELEAESFHFFYDSLAFPGGLEHGMQLLKDHDPETINVAIEYLKVNPQCFKSGEVKQAIALLLKDAPLTTSHIKDVREILLTAVQTNDNKEYREYCKLAIAVADDAFSARVEEIMQQSHELQVIQRAQRMLDALTLSS